MIEFLYPLPEDHLQFFFEIPWFIATQ